MNAVWVGRFLGEAALTATANANNIMFFLIGSVFGFGMASTILIGQAIGARDIAQARRVVGTSATFFIGLSVIIAIAGWFMAHPLLAAMGTPAASLPLAEAYLQIIFLAMPTLYAFAFLTAALRGAGDSRTPFRFLMVSVALDIALNPVLIFGMGPFPRWASPARPGPRSSRRRCRWPACCCTCGTSATRCGWAAPTCACSSST